MTYQPLFSQGQHVMLLMKPSPFAVAVPGRQPTPVPLQGVIAGEDLGGVLVHANDPDVQGQAYVPFTRIETILLLPALTEQERRRSAFQGRVQRQRALDELDRIFFEMVDRRGKYSPRAAPEGGSSQD